MNDYEFYRAGHKTIGCRACHMIGIPLLVASVIVYLFYNKREPDMSAVWSWLFGLGLFFQLAGHWVFEDNDPELGRVVAAALRSCVADWKKFLTTGTLVACLLFTLPAEAAEKKLWLPLRVTRGVLLAPVRYVKYVIHDVNQAIYLDFRLRHS